ncbi:MAG: Xaa-Pro peptidase family protein [Candidatus Hadarchaeum sp.]
MFCSEELRTARLKKIRDFMKTAEMDALILTVLENVRYATDFRPLHGIFFVSNYIAVIRPDEKPILLANDADAMFVKYKLPWLEFLPLPSFTPSAESKTSESLLQALAGCKHRIGFDILTIAQFNFLQKYLANVEFISCADEILLLRAHKLDLEIEIINRAAQFADIGMDAVRKHIAPGVPEFRLVAEALYAIKTAGAEAESHLPAIRAGENAAMQQRVDSDTALRPGDAVIVDLGARYLGYSAEFCRTMAVGQPSARLKEMYKVLFEAYSIAIENVKPRVPAKRIDGIIRQAITDAGYPDYPHATGHGIGMSNVEYPTINPRSEAIIEENMVICLEPGIYLPGIGGVKEEDVILVTKTGSLLLTKTPYDEQFFK